MTDFRLRFPVRDIGFWAARYSTPSEDLIASRVGPAARARGYLTRAEFLTLCRWKTPRTQSRCETNDASFVQAVTRVALSTSDERLAIEVLTLLNGVSWPTASSILHFCARKPYPVLDYRALWSLSVRQPSAYAFPLWSSYTAFTRALAKKAGVPMRTLDRALWQYSKERQPAA